MLNKQVRSTFRPVSFQRTTTSRLDSVNIKKTKTHEVGGPGLEQGKHLTGINQLTGL
jgi:hypothetical protein